MIKNYHDEKFGCSKSLQCLSGSLKYSPSPQNRYRLLLPPLQQVWRSCFMSWLVPSWPPEWPASIQNIYQLPWCVDSGKSQCHAEPGLRSEVREGSGSVLMSLTCGWRPAATFPEFLITSQTHERACGDAWESHRIHRMRVQSESTISSRVHGNVCFFAF